MTTKKIEDDQAVWDATMRVIKSVEGLTPDQCVEAMFSALTATVAIMGWSFDTYRDWFLRSAEISFAGYVQEAAKTST